MFPLLLERARQTHTVVLGRAELEVERTLARTTTVLSGVVGGDRNWSTSSRWVLVKVALSRASRRTIFEGVWVEAAGLEAAEV